MEGQILTGHWFRVDRTLAQSPVSSFDQGVFIWHDRTLTDEVTGRWTLRGEVTGR